MKNIRILCSVRPLLHEEEEEDLYPLVERSCIALPPKDEFEFSGVFDGDLEKLGQDLVTHTIKKLSNGHDCAILFYGPTGAGKTTAFCGEDKGVVWRMLRALYEASQEDVFLTLEVMEIYNGKVTPILKEEDIEEDEIHEILTRAVAMRRVGATLANNRSSRGHGIFTFHVPGKSKTRLTFIDLAGSERLTQTGTDPERIQEAIHVNKSLTALRDVVEQAAANKFIPYRNSPLTLHLRSVLAHPESGLTIVLCCNRSRTHSIETLRFGRTATKIRPSTFVPPPKIPRAEQKKVRLDDLQKQLEATREELRDCQELCKKLIIIRKCRLCGEEGHNRRTCLKRLSESSSQGDGRRRSNHENEKENHHEKHSSMVLVGTGGTP